MYAYIRGPVAEIGTDRAILDAGGVGYELFCSANTLKLLRQGKETKLLTHFHLAEGVMALYGFHSEEERQMFRRLISVTRIGPKLALSVLSVLQPSDVAAAIITDNVRAFDRVPGMGRKTAQRVLLELKEKIDTQELAGVGFAPEAAESADLRAQAAAALVSLGYDGATASKAVAQVQDAGTVEEMITKALRGLAR